MPLPDQIRGSIGGLTTASRHDPKVTSQHGRAASDAALDARLLADIDAREANLPEPERQRRLVYARKAHFARLAYASLVAREKKREAKRR